MFMFFFQAEDGIRDLVRSRGLGDVYKRQPVKWTQTIQHMILDGFHNFYEVGGNGTVLSGFLKRINREIPVSSL